jgi:uncharacterized protein (DUF58 family)
MPAMTDRSARAHGPGDLTITAVVLFALGAYGIAAGGVSGEARAVAVGVFAFTLFIIGIVWPIVALARVDFSARVPPDATVDDEIPVHISIRGRVSRVEVRIIDPSGTWWRTAVPSGGVIMHRVTRRGVFDHIRVQIRTSAPLGVFLRTRQARVALPEPITVGPRPLVTPVALHAVPAQIDAPAEHALGAAGADVVRSVRPYVPGDAARLVHWPTSARRASLAVREHDPPANEGLAVVVELTGTRDDVETAAGIACGIARGVLARGGRLVLCTREADGPHAEPVLDRREVGRRLARAIAGTPAEPPAGWPVQEVRAVDVASRWSSLQPPESDRGASAARLRLESWRVEP